jgi:hypothetical protein
MIKKINKYDKKFISIIMKIQRMIIKIQMYDKKNLEVWQ